MRQSLQEKIAEKIQENIANGTWDRGEYIPPIYKIVEQCIEIIDKHCMSGNCICPLEGVTFYDKALRSVEYAPDRYTFYIWNLTKDELDLMKGNLLNFTFDSSDVTFEDRTMDYVEKRVHPNDASEFLGFLNKNTLKSKADEPDYFTSIEYREKVNQKYRWIRLDLAIAIDSKTDEVLIYLLYQDIDKEKRNELILKERTDEDALTGALSRRAFMLQTEQLISESDESCKHAFLMVDIDDFKAVNDTFGHPIGDTVLSEIAKSIHSIIRKEDLLGRIGGDEFMICLKNIEYDAVIEKKAAQINELLRREFENGSYVSGSIGIAVYPRDGKTYDQLYSSADIALYNTKKYGKNRYEFYKKEMNRSEGSLFTMNPFEEQNELSYYEPSQKEKKILVIDDIERDRRAITELIKDQYTVLEAKDGNRALMTLRRYSSNIAAVLLKLNMSGMDGFEILSIMQKEIDLKSIPVIIVSEEENDDIESKAIEMGATDFIIMPFEQRMLQYRIKNSINKLENENARIQNSYLKFQGEEELRYRYIVQSTDTIVIVQDWVNNVFNYDKSVSRYLAGIYDHRPLWKILLSDMVASSMDVKKMQTIVYGLANSHKDTQASVRVKLRTRSDEKHWFEMKALKIVDSLDLTSKIFITLRDINNTVLVEEKLRKLVEYDALTGIYNRKAFLEKADEIIKKIQNGKWMLSIIDIDSFNVFNHLYGHDEGDKLLIYFAKHLSATVETWGGVTGRLQADQFAVLHPCLQYYIQNLSELCNMAVKEYSSTKKISFCIGRCYIDDENMPINTILDRAMIAHREAKAGPMKVVFFTDDMQKKLLYEQKISSQMEQALEEEQFSLYYQPIYEYHTKKIVTAEVLVRWVTRDNRVIPPNMFIPLFEQNGFIVKLDAYIWEKACKNIRQWLDAGIEVVPISVNVSRLDLYSGTFVETIKTITTKYNIPPSLLRFEITESVYMKDIEQMITYVEKLQQMGFIIEMDDFGSGYSSLNILSEVPVDILKLDMRFILGEDRICRKSKIIGHIINMAKSSDMDIIAEGVETLEQAEFLNSLGCYNMQGYYFNKPMETSQFVRLLQKKGD